MQGFMVPSLQGALSSHPSFIVFWSPHSFVNCITVHDVCQTTENPLCDSNSSDPHYAVTVSIGHLDIVVKHQHEKCIQKSSYILYFCSSLMGSLPNKVNINQFPISMISHPQTEGSDWPSSPDKECRQQCYEYSAKQIFNLRFPVYYAIGFSIPYGPGSVGSAL